MIISLKNIVFVLTITAYVYSIIKANRLLIRLWRNDKTPLSDWKGSSRTKDLIKLKRICTDGTVRKEVSKVILFIRLSRIVAFGGFLLFVLLMVIDK